MLSFRAVFMCGNNYKRDGDKYFAENETVHIRLVASAYSLATMT